MFDLLVKIQKNSNDPRVRAILGQLNVNQRGGGAMRSPQGPPITTIGMRICVYFCRVKR